MVQDFLAFSIYHLCVVIPNNMIPISLPFCSSDAKTAHFCVAQTQKVKTANIIFDGTTLAIHYPVRCVCTVETEDGGPFIMRAPDLRLQSLSKNCSTHTTLSGLNEIDIMCNYSFTSMDSVRRTSPSTITVSFHSSPEFIWIEAKAEGKIFKHVVGLKCKEV